MGERKQIKTYGNKENEEVSYWDIGAYEKYCLNEKAVWQQVYAPGA